MNTYLLRWRKLGICCRNILEHGRGDPPAVINIVECWSSKKGREEQNVARKIEKARHLCYGTILLVICKKLWFDTAVVDIPTECMKLHYQYHLSAGNVDQFGGGKTLPDNMVR